MSPEDLSKTLELHRKWHLGEPGGVRANLRSADLTGADLAGADLAGADLTGADLRSADLRSANLAGANLSGADLTGADLTGANLYGADLTGAYLAGAYLTGANLYGAYLTGANLYGADLTNVTLPQIAIVPEKGSFIGWKKVQIGSGARVILELEIQADAQRTNSTGRKCRASAVRVISASIEAPEYYSFHDAGFVYKVGEVASVKDFDPDIRVECTRGIHFFITRAEAEAY